MSRAADDQALLELWRQGDQAAAKQLFDQYVEQVLALARRRLKVSLTRRVDEQDIAQSVFRTFFHRARAGQFHLEEADDLCKLLARITVHKTLRQVAFHSRAKRDANSENRDTQEMLLNHLASGPTPEETAAFLDQLEQFLGQLRPEERKILELRMEGRNTLEIAELLGVSDRKVRRLMERIRGLAAKLDGAPVSEDKRATEEHG